MQLYGEFYIADIIFVIFSFATTHIMILLFIIPIRAMKAATILFPQHTF